MKKIKYNYDEEIILETLPNGLKVYLYNTNKTKNFYVTVSTYFGAEVMKYKKGSTTYDVTLGSAHFLEHRVMDFTKNKEAMKKINEYGSMVNAYTTYNGTNYNIFGSEKILDNITLLFDRVFKANIKKEDVENEKEIILEEYNMYYDDPYYLLHINLNKNMFDRSFIKYPVLGTKEGIESADYKELTRLYNDFYTPDNMFVVITGSFNTNEILEYIKDYMKDIKGKNKTKVIRPKENLEIPVSYEEINLSVNEPKIIVGYKLQMPTKINKNKYMYGLKTALSNEFSSTGDTHELLKSKGIKILEYAIEEVDKYLMLYFKASTEKTEEFVNTIDNSLKNLKIDSASLERKKRGFKSSLILAFEDIIDVEDIITTEELKYKKVLNKKEEIIDSLNIAEINKWVKSIDIKNKSVLKIIK